MKKEKIENSDTTLRQYYWTYQYVSLSLYLLYKPDIRHDLLLTSPMSVPEILPASPTRS